MPETKEKYHHIPNPRRKVSDFIDKCGTITLSKSKGILALVCRLKGEDKNKSAIRTYLFDKTKWSMEEAKAWVKSHSKAGGDYEMKGVNSFDCECIKCGYEVTSETHCADLKCPKCGGQMRRKERPGPGQSNLKTISRKNKTFVTANLVLQEDKTQDGQLNLVAANDQFASNKYFIAAEMVHEGENSNADVFTQEELISSYKTTRHNPIDWEHNWGELLGSTFSSELIPAKDDKPVALAVNGVLWRNSPALVKDNRDAIVRKRFNEGSLHVSMECYFDRAVCQVCGFSSDDMLEFERHRATHIEMFEKGKRPPRILVGVEFAGLGIVERPADEDADALIMDGQSFAGQVATGTQADWVATDSNFCFYTKEDIEQIAVDAIEKFKSQGNKEDKNTKNKLKGGSNSMITELFKDKVEKFADIVQAFKDATIEITLSADDTFVAKRGKFEDLADEFKSVLLKFLSNLEEGTLNEETINAFFENGQTEEKTKELVEEATKQIKKSLEDAQKNAKVKEKEFKTKVELIEQLTAKVQQYEKDIAEKEKNEKIEKAIKEIEDKNVELGESREKITNLLAKIIEDDEAVKSFIKDIVEFFNSLKVTASSLKNGKLTLGGDGNEISVLSNLDAVEKKYEDKNKKEE